MDRNVSIHVSCILFLVSGSTILIFWGLYSLGNGSSSAIEWELWSLSGSTIVYLLVLDWTSLLFLSFVLLISSIVLYYSGGYISGDPNFNRFIYLVVAFVISMGAIILSPNLISILLGWDGLGLVSYALVIYYQNENSANAGILTVLSNRVGDAAVLLSIGLIVQLGVEILFYMDII